MFWKKKKDDIPDEEYLKLVAEIEQNIKDQDELEELMKANNMKIGDVLNIVKESLE